VERISATRGTRGVRKLYFRQHGVRRCMCVRTHAHTWTASIALRRRHEEKVRIESRLPLLMHTPRPVDVRATCKREPTMTRFVRFGQFRPFLSQLFISRNPAPTETPRVSRVRAISNSDFSFVDYFPFPRDFVRETREKESANQGDFMIFRSA